MKSRNYYLVGVSFLTLTICTNKALAQSWTDHQAIEGQITIDSPAPHTTNIQQHTDFAKVQGNASIAAGHTVNLHQPTSTSKYVVYDTSADPTKIMGNLNANGEVYIFDQNGVIFGQDSRVDVGSLVATTGTIADAQLKSGNGRYVIESAGQGKIENNGHITIQETGLAAFVAPHVVNNGTINAKMGKVAMGAGERVTLDLHGDQLIEIALDDATSAALLENKGTINVDGGLIEVRAQAAKGIVDSIINMDGLTNASSVTQHGGKIILDGGNAGTVYVAGDIKANGKTGGGVINVSGQDIITEKKSHISANATESGNGGRIVTVARNMNEAHAKLEAKGGTQSGNGGFVEVSGKSFILSSEVDTSADNGEIGEFLIDPEIINIYLGKGTNNTVNDINNIYEEYLVNTSSNISLQATETIRFLAATTPWGPGEDPDGDPMNLSLNKYINLRVTTNGVDNNPNVDNGIFFNTTNYGNDFTISNHNNGIYVRYDDSSMTMPGIINITNINITTTTTTRPSLAFINQSHGGQINVYGSINAPTSDVIFDGDNIESINILNNKTHNIRYLSYFNTNATGLSKLSGNFNFYDAAHILNEGADLLIDGIITLKTDANMTLRYFNGDSNIYSTENAKIIIENSTRTDSVFVAYGNEQTVRTTLNLPEIINDSNRAIDLRPNNQNFTINKITTKGNVDIRNNAGSDILINDELSANNLNIWVNPSNSTNFTINAPIITENDFIINSFNYSTLNILSDITVKNKFYATLRDSTVLFTGNIDVSDSFTINGTRSGITIDNGELILPNTSAITTTNEDIIISTVGQYYAPQNSISTNNGGNITITHGVGGQINDTVQSINNTGNGQNTIYLNDGTYNNQNIIDINKNNLSILSKNGAPNVTIDSASTSGAFRIYNTENTRIGNIGHGLTINSSTAESAFSAGNSINLVIDSNYINLTNTNIDVSGLSLDGDINVAFINNKFTQNNMIYAGVNLEEFTDTILIQGNEFNNIDHGIYNQDDVNTVNLYSNIFDNNLIAIYLGGSTIDFGNASQANTIRNSQQGMYFTGTDVQLVNESLGSTIFSNIAGYYIEFNDNAFFPYPFVNASNVDFDGISAANNAGEISQVDYNYLESKNWHRFDDPTLGLLWFGIVQTAPEPNITPPPMIISSLLNYADKEEFLESSSENNRSYGSYRLRIVSLPYVSLSDIGLTIDSLSPVGLAQIAPAAGGSGAMVPQSTISALQSNCWNREAGIVSVNVSLDPLSSLNNAKDCGIE